MKKSILTTYSLACFTTVILVIGLQSLIARDCYLNVFVTEVASTNKYRSKLFSSFSSTLFNQVTGKEYQGKRNGQHVFYKNIPSGSYKITIARAGYKTSVRTTDFVCNTDSTSIEVRSPSVDILMFPGEADQFVNESDSSRLLPKVNGIAVAKTGTQDPLPEVLNGGVLNGKALSLRRPEYTTTARYMRLSGPVDVEVVIDEHGNVMSAEAISGRPLLRFPAEAAARTARFPATAIDGKLLRVRGIISYNFN